MKYKVNPRNRFFEVFCFLPEDELFRSGVMVTFSSLVDLSKIEQTRISHGIIEKISYTSFVAKALALTLKEFPYANCKVFEYPWWCFWGKRRHVSFKNFDIAIANEKDMPGLEFSAFVDIMRNVDSLDFVEIKQWLKDLASSTEDTNKQLKTFNFLINRLPSLIASFIVWLPSRIPSFWVKYRGAAALISSPGKYGPDQIAATWAWPLGISFGKVKKRPIAKDDLSQIVPSFYITMNFDRRVMAGAPAARFFARLIQRLEECNFTEDIARS